MSTFIKLATVVDSSYNTYKIKLVIIIVKDIKKKNAYCVPLKRIRYIGYFIVHALERQIF